MESMLFWEFVSIVACLILSAFFSSAETALTSLSYVKLRHLIESDQQYGSRLKLWLEQPNRSLTTILIGNNIVNILASALATDMANSYFKNTGIAIAVGLMTFLILVFGEIVPKTIAKHYAESYSIYIIRTLSAFYLLLFPFTWVLVKLTRLVAKYTGGDIDKASPFMTTEDIEFLINLGHREGVLKKYEEEMLQSIMEFRDTVIREIMVPRTSMVTIELATPIEEILQNLIKDGHSRIPVFDETIDNIVGLLYPKDCLKELIHNNQVDIKKILRPTFFVSEMMKISLLLKEFQRRKTHMAIVVDEYGGTAGVVTLEDIIEEIVGEIQDEYDDEEKHFRRTVDGKILAEGNISLNELEESFSIEFPDEDQYETLGGFLIYLYGRIPQVDTTIMWNDIRFTVKEADERRIIRVEIQNKQKLVTKET